MEKNINSAAKIAVPLLALSLGAGCNSTMSKFGDNLIRSTTGTESPAYTNVFSSEKTTYFPIPDTCSMLVINNGARKIFTHKELVKILNGNIVNSLTNGPFAFEKGMKDVHRIDKGGFTYSLDGLITNPNSGCNSSNTASNKDVTKFAMNFAFASKIPDVSNLDKYRRQAANIIDPDERNEEIDAKVAEKISKHIFPSPDQLQLLHEERRKDRAAILGAIERRAIDDMKKDKGAFRDLVMGEKYSKNQRKMGKAGIELFLAAATDISYLGMTAVTSTIKHALNYNNFEISKGFQDLNNEAGAYAMKNMSTPTISPKVKFFNNTIYGRY